MGVHTDCLNVWYVDKSENTAVMLHETVVVIQGKSVKSNGSIYTELIIKWEKYYNVGTVPNLIKVQQSQNRYTWHTWPLTFLAWDRYFIKKNGGINWNICLFWLFCLGPMVYLFTKTFILFVFPIL